MINPKYSAFLIDQDMIEALFVWLENPGYGHFILHAKDNRVIYAEETKTIKPKKEELSPARNGRH